MKARMKVAIAAGMALAITGATFAFSACTPKETSLTDQQKIYQKYVSYAEAAGDEVLTYEQWLDSVKGKDGKNGEDGEDGSKWFLGTMTPSNDMGNDGDFYLNRSNFDIYIKDSGAWTLMGNIKGADGAQGPAGSNGTDGTNGTNGLTPHIDNDTKHWFIGDTDTGVLAEGTGGASGANQTNWYSGKSSPVSDESARNAVAGDFYLDTSSFDIYNYVAIPGTSNGNGVCWQWLGNLKEANNNYIHQSFNPITEDSSVDISSLTNGWYTVYINSGNITAVNIEGKDITSTAVKFGLRSSGIMNTTNIALIKKETNDKTLKFTGTSTKETDVSIEPYGGQLLTAVDGNVVQAVVFVLPKDTAAESLQNYPACYLNGNVEGKIKLTDAGGSVSSKNKTIYNGTSSLGIMGQTSQALEIDITQPLYFVGYDADFANKITATTFKIELAE